MHRFFALLVLVVGMVACGKGPRTNPPIDWHTHFETASEIARREHKPILLFFEASWDCAGKELLHTTFTDPEVRNLMTNFIAIHFDSADDEAPGVTEMHSRFKVIGIPTVLLLAADESQTELLRFNEFVKPKVMAAALQKALWQQREVIGVN